MLTILKAYASWMERYAGWTLAVLAGITIVLASQLSRLEVHNDLQTFYPNAPVTQTYQHISETFGGDHFSRTLFVRFKPQEGQSITSPEAILDMEAVLNILRQTVGVISAKGLPDLVKLISSGLHGGDPDFAVLPVDGDPLGYSFAQVIQLTTQRLSTVQDFVSPQGTALAVATIAQHADILEVAKDVEQSLAELTPTATRFELMSYGGALNTFNKTTGQDLQLIVPLTAMLMALVLLWTFRLQKRAWAIMGSLVMAISALSLEGLIVSVWWWMLVVFSLAFCCIALWMQLQSRHSANTKLKAIVAVLIVFAGLGIGVSWMLALATLMLILFLLSFYALHEIYLPLLVIGVSTIWTFGWMAMFDIPLSFLLIAIFPLLFGVGLDDALHLLLRFRQERQAGHEHQEALKEALSHTGRTLWYTTLSTIVGFAALMFSGSPPVQAFGLLATVAMFSAFVVTLTLIPGIQQLLGREVSLSAPASEPQVTGLWRKITQPRLAWVWLILVSGLGVLAFANGQQLKVFPYDLRWLLPEGNQQAVLYERINEEFKNYDQVQILIEGDVVRLDLMRALNQTLGPELSASPFVRQVRHIGRLLDDVRFSDAEAESRFLENFVVDPDQAYLNLLNHAKAQSPLKSRFDGLIHQSDESQYDSTVIRIDVVRAHEPEAVSTITEDLQQRLERVRPDLENLGLNVSITGSPYLEALSLTALKEGFFQSMGLAFLLVGVVMAVLFRSVLWSLVCLLPLALVMALELATIHWLGLRISASTALVAALGIGLGVDYTIHLAQRVRENGKVIFGSALVSRALISASTTTLAAFGLMVFGQIPWNRDFGLLVSTAIIYALLATLWVLPALLTVAKPWLFRTERRTT